MTGDLILRVGTSASGPFESLPCPAVFEVALMDIDASTTTRSANGTMLRDRVCGGDKAKRKLTIEWAAAVSNGSSMNEDRSRNVSNDTYATILNALANEFVYVVYYDPYTASFRGAWFYAGDRTVQMYNFNLHGGRPIWKSLKVNLIER